MAVASNKSVRPDLGHRLWRGETGREVSPERNPVWTEPARAAAAGDKTSARPKAVPVVYYLSRNGQLEHPHFMEVTLASPEGLYLRDVIRRLNLLRGKGMAALYAWSSKRSYKNGFVWHDLTEDDFIYPAHGNEYVLKGSELLQIDPPTAPTSAATASATSGSSPSTVSVCSGSTSSCSSVSSDKDIAVPIAPETPASAPSSRLRKKLPPHRWGSLDLGEYKVYKASNGDAAAEDGSKANAADAATQTDDQHRLRQWRRRDKSRSEIPDLEPLPHAGGGSQMDHAVATTTELERDDISPPPSSSSPETLETLIKADVGRARASAADNSDHQRDLGLYPTGRARASAVLINLISCGAISVKDHHGGAVAPHYRGQQQQRGVAPRGGNNCEPDPRGYAPSSTCGVVSIKRDGVEWRGFPSVQLEDKEYFSGSLIETKKKGAADGAGEFAALKRSNSYNADRSSKMAMDVAERDREMDAVRSKCIPRKPKSALVNNRKDAGAAISRSSHSGGGSSKRISSAGDETPM